MVYVVGGWTTTDYVYPMPQVVDSLLQCEQVNLVDYLMSVMSKYNNSINWPHLTDECALFFKSQVHVHVDVFYQLNSSESVERVCCYCWCH